MASPLQDSTSKSGCMPARRWHFGHDNFPTPIGRHVSLYISTAVFWELFICEPFQALDCCEYYPISRNNASTYAIFRTLMSAHEQYTCPHLHDCEQVDISFTVYRQKERTQKIWAFVLTSHHTTLQPGSQCRYYFDYNKVSHTRGQG